MISKYTRSFIDLQQGGRLSEGDGDTRQLSYITPGLQ
jgi:hypothetical protein